jgi:tetratricopeptide (TPR) repeat protein
MEEVDKAGGVIGDIDRLDPGATIHNPECAALKGRWLGAIGKTAAARDVLAAAYESNKESYYLADLLGQALLEGGEMPKAQSIYREALDTIERLEGANFWMHSTAATAAIVAGDEDAAKRHLQAVRSYKPTASELESIERGLLSLQQRLKLPDAQFSTWRAWLRESELVT